MKDSRYCVLLKDYASSSSSGNCDGANSLFHVYTSKAAAFESAELDPTYIVPTDFTFEDILEQDEALEAAVENEKIFNNFMMLAVGQR